MLFTYMLEPVKLNYIHMMVRNIANLHQKYYLCIDTVYEKSLLECDTCSETCCKHNEFYYDTMYLSSFSQNVEFPVKMMTASRLPQNVEEKIEKHLPSCTSLR